MLKCAARIRIVSPISDSVRRRPAGGFYPTVDLATVKSFKQFENSITQFHIANNIVPIARRRKDAPEFCLVSDLKGALFNSVFRPHDKVSNVGGAIVRR